jgi:RNA polymerase sigma factor (sigma-70 family)
MKGSLGRGHRTEREDEYTFSCAYRQHGRDLHRFCLRHLGDSGAAEEALATVFLEAWRRRDEVDFSKPIRPWLFGVARNVIRNQRRAEHRRKVTVQNLEYLHCRHSEDPSEELARRQATAALICSLGALPDEQRQVVGLCLLGDSSYEAAADDLEVPVGTVRSRLYRARLNLALAVRTADGS